MSSEATKPDLLSLEVEDARLALLLAAIAPALGGVLLAGPVGSGKSSLLRQARLLWSTDLPFINLPLNVSEDRLLGGLDFGLSLPRGHRVYQPGLLQQAHGGVLYIDELNLLHPRLQAIVGTSLANRQVQIEREGLSYHLNTTFCLMASYNPAEGEVSPELADRVGLWVRVETDSAENKAGRIENMRQHLVWGQPPDSFSLLIQKVAPALRCLPLVTIGDWELNSLIKIALAVGVKGNRVDEIAALAARAHAAFRGSFNVEELDLQVAVKLVIAPRATRLPQLDEDDSQPSQSSSLPEQLPSGNSVNSGKLPQTEGALTQAQSGAAQPGPDLAQTQEEILPFEDSALPTTLFELAEKLIRKNIRNNGGASLRKQAILFGYRRGHYIKATSIRPPIGQIAFLPTLKAALLNSTTSLSGINVKNSPFLKIEKADLRYKQLSQKAGSLFILAVDASGSMGLNRMQQAKGACLRLLQQAYIHRDKVALIAFRGEKSKLLLPPTSSLQYARYELEQLPTGGGTPLASALLQALNLCKTAQKLGLNRVFLIILSDGRSNVPINGGQTIETELKLLAQSLHKARVKSLVIDTNRRFSWSGSAERLATILEANYTLLPYNKNLSESASLIQQEVTKLAL